MLILPRRRLRTLLKILKEYFDFCNREDRNKFYLAVVLGVMLFLAGFLGEMISRSAPERNRYQVKERL